MDGVKKTATTNLVALWDWPKHWFYRWAVGTTSRLLASTCKETPTVALLPKYKTKQADLIIWLVPYFFQNKAGCFFSLKGPLILDTESTSPLMRPLDMLFFEYYASLRASPPCFNHLQNPQEGWGEFLSSRRGIYIFAWWVFLSFPCTVLVASLLISCLNVLIVLCSYLLLFHTILLAILKQAWKAGDSVYSKIYISVTSRVTDPASAGWTIVSRSLHILHCLSFSHACSSWECLRRLNCWEAPKLSFMPIL